jgi:hypothetical protein
MRLIVFIVVMFGERVTLVILFAFALIDPVHDNPPFSVWETALVRLVSCFVVFVVSTLSLPLPIS